jgi:hypothetical protein
MVILAIIVSAPVFLWMFAPISVPLITRAPVTTIVILMASMLIVLIMTVFFIWVFSVATLFPVIIVAVTPMMIRPLLVISVIVFVFLLPLSRICFRIGGN